MAEKALILTKFCSYFVPESVPCALFRHGMMRFCPCPTLDRTEGTMAHDTIQVVIASAAILRGEQYLIARRSEHEEEYPGVLSFVSGTIEPQDISQPDVLHAMLRREIREEVGVEVADFRYATSGVFESTSGTIVLNIVFLCHYTGGEPRAVDLLEVSDVLWMTAAEFLAHPDCPEWNQRYMQACEAVR